MFAADGEPATKKRATQTSAWVKGWVGWEKEFKYRARWLKSAPQDGPHYQASCSCCSTRVSRLITFQSSLACIRAHEASGMHRDTLADEERRASFVALFQSGSAIEEKEIEAFSKNPLPLTQFKFVYHLLCHGK